MPSPGDTQTFTTPRRPPALTLATSVHGMTKEYRRRTNRRPSLRSSIASCGPSRKSLTIWSPTRIHPTHRSAVPTAPKGSHANGDERTAARPTSQTDIVFHRNLNSGPTSGTGAGHPSFAIIEASHIRRIAPTPRIRTAHLRQCNSISRGAATWYQTADHDRFALISMAHLGAARCGHSLRSGHSQARGAQRCRQRPGVRLRASERSLDGMYVLDARGMSDVRSCG